MSQYPTESYHIEQRPSTIGAATVGVLLAGLALAASPEMPSVVFPAVSPVVRPGTIGQYGNLFVSAGVSQTDFEGAVAAFYSTLLAKQEPLGKEFEQVLYDNLWELYVRS